MDYAPDSERLIMSEDRPHLDTLRRWTQVSGKTAAQLVRITAHDEANRYTARPIAFDADGQPDTVGEATLTVVNLAEPTNTPGQVDADTDAVAVDVGGRWVVFLPPSSHAIFPAKVISSQGNAAYSVREQAATGAGTFTDADGATDVTAHNLAELSLGDGAALDQDIIVLVHAILDSGDPPTVRYVFDHPAYAKYLD